MPKIPLHIRISKRRKNKLQLYAAIKEKSITSLIEDWIDSLPQEEIDKNGAILSRLSIDD
ncbi:hypothetical protein BC008_38170 [Mastigocoleus testarum BC008]|uniref:CopG family transcriptional regulator n=1 Tax=Mastigocoleus testarum BC008 TaxID=371196 RepID=A0A0V7ZDQ4_9CYAN|nr:hypothetical protein BC008_38170 [Mastigocoleus testarum BC008]